MVLNVITAMDRRVTPFVEASGETSFTARVRVVWNDASGTRYFERALGAYPTAVKAESVAAAKAAYLATAPLETLVPSHPFPGIDGEAAED